MGVGQLARWLETGPPKVFWLSGFSFEILDGNESGGGTSSGSEDGVVVQGLFIEGAQWDGDGRMLVEEEHAVPSPMPPIRLLPVLKQTNEYNKGKSRVEYYQCPLYVTRERRGRLSTTGISSNLTIVTDIPCAVKGGAGKG